MKKITINDLSIEEKLRLICAYDSWQTVTFDNKLPKVKVSDGPVGLRTMVKDDNNNEITLKSISYPSVSCLANTFNKELAYKMGEALANDAIERDVDILLAPGVNIKRNPLNGRNFEYFSEDPYLAGMLAKQYILGLQDNHIGACIKHFCCNNLEYNRFYQSSEVDVRTLHEIYYKPFEIALHANPYTIMCSYNRINGEYASEYKVGFDTLRNSFNYKGVIISDWDAVRNRAKSLNAGLDIEFPYSERNYKQLLEDYKNNKVDEECLNNSVNNILNLIYKCNDDKQKRKITLSFDERVKIAKELAKESIVLLKNDDNILPLKENTSIALSGCYAKGKENFVVGGGSSFVRWIDKEFDLEKELKERFAHVDYERAFYVNSVANHGSNICNPLKSQNNALSNDVNIICVGTGPFYEYESGDRETIKLSVVQERAILTLASLNPNTIVVIFAGSAVDISSFKDKVKAIIYAGFCGQYGDEAIVDVISGKACPNGRLSETFANHLEDIKAVNSYVDGRITCYSEGLDVGYRYFLKHQDKAMYPFGYGLSYASFKYENLNVSVTESKIKISFVITNTSAYDAKEVIQIYASEMLSKVYRPIRELKAFDKVFIKANESKKVEMTINKEDLAYYSIGTNSMEVNPGVYKIEICKDAFTPILTKTIKII